MIPFRSVLVADCGMQINGIDCDDDDAAVCVYRRPTNKLLLSPENPAPNGYEIEFRRTDAGFYELDSCADNTVHIQRTTRLLVPECVV